MSDETTILAAVDRAKPNNSVDYVLNVVAERGLREINEQILSCKKCDIYNVGKSIVTMGFAKPYSIMVLSEHVTKDQLENSNDTVFVPYENSNIAARLGELLAERFKDEALFYADVVHCYPYRKGYNPRPPSTKEITACIPFLWDIVRIMRPTAIMIMGNIALNAVLPGQFIADRDHGKWTEVRDIPAMIFQKPGDILMTSQEGDFIKDLDSFVAALKEGPDEVKILVK